MARHPKPRIAEDTHPIRRNTDEKRFEIEVDGTIATLEYIEAGPRIVLAHTEVPRHLEGRGLASRLAQHGLEYARENGLRVVPICPFVLVYLRRHPKYQDLVG